MLELQDKRGNRARILSTLFVKNLGENGTNTHKTEEEEGYVICGAGRA